MGDRIKVLSTITCLILGSASAFAQSALEECMQAKTAAGEQTSLEARAQCWAEHGDTWTEDNRALISEIQSELEQKALDEGRITRLVDESRASAVSEDDASPVRGVFTGPPVTYTREYPETTYSSLPELDAEVLRSLEVKVTQVAADGEFAYLQIAVPDMPKGYLLTDLTVHASSADCSNTQLLEEAGKVAIQAHYHNVGKTLETAHTTARVKIDSVWADIECIEPVSARAFPLPASPEPPVEEAVASAEDAATETPANADDSVDSAEPAEEAPESSKDN